MASRTLTCKNLQDYLTTLNRNVLERLFNSPATCLAVFRELPPLSQHFVNRMLFVGPAVSQVLVASWIPLPEPGGNNKLVASRHIEASQVLTEMHIWKEVTDRRGNPAYILNATFADNLKISMLGGGKPWCMSSSLSEDPHPRSPEFLDQYASERWDSVLQFLVQPQEVPRAISRDAIRTLLHAKLIESGAGQRMQITSTGFQFLLLERSSQVWYFILKYLETVGERGLSLVACLQFLFKLSFATHGKDYSMEGMDEELQTFLQHLREFGFVFLRKRSSGRFYPTRLVLNITSGEKKCHLLDEVSGNLVLETNFRVYAYNASQLQVALLAIFCEVECRFPNLVVCCITRHSIRRALLKGITAEQIINYLRLHAHKQMMKFSPIVPKTVSDQIQLWELERERLEYTEGVLYKDFILQQDYALLANFAKSKGVLIYADSKNRTLVVSKKGHPSVKTFWKEAQTK